MFPVLIANVVAPAMAGLADTGVLDVSLYDALHVILVRDIAGWGRANIYSVDDAGVQTRLFIDVSPTDDYVAELTQISFCWGKGLVMNQAIDLPLPRRVRYTLQSLAGQIAGIKIYGCRSGR